jgi:hypothetical protein
VVAARRSIKVDFGPLFAPTSPERLLEHVRPKEKSKYNGQDMSQALSNILEETSPLRAISAPSSQADPFYDHDKSGMSHRHRSTSPYNLPPRQIQNDVGIIGLSPPGSSYSEFGSVQTIPPLSQMTEEESYRYLDRGEIPARFQGESQGNDDQEAMEWTSQESQSSQHRAFQPARAPRQSQLFSQAPVAPDPSPFWYKGLPPAPISQAHRLRNPPNAPRLQPRSQEAKTNFFNRITGREPISNTVLAITQKEEVDDVFSTPRRVEVEFAQPKFFPPATSDAVTGLSDMFEQSFTLKPDKTEVQEQAEKTRTSVWNSAAGKRHILTTLTLLVALLGWNYSFTHPELHAMKVPLGVMIVCAVIGLRSTTDCFLASWSEKKPSLFSSASALFAALQVFGAAYAISEIVAGRAEGDACQAQGTLLVGSMVVQEACFAALSR